MVKLNKKGQTAGMVAGLVFGIATLVIGVIIALVIVSTLSDADLLSDSRDTVTTLNEAGFLNETGYTLDGASDARFVSGSITITGAVNLTDNSTFLVANATVSDAGIVTNSSTSTWTSASFNYTYTQKTLEEFTTEGMSGNLTGGIDNVSAKIPTVLLVAAIVLILSVLALLVGAWQRMRIGGSSI